MKKLLIAATVTAFAAGSAFSQTSFEALDTDSSGGVTLEEAAAAGLNWTEEQFAAADADGDGTLNPEEFAAATQ